MFGFTKSQGFILNLCWIAFFLTFLSWFNLAPFNTTLKKTLGLTQSQIQILMICNIALTVPARVIVGNFIDRLGPKIIFVGLLIFTAMVSVLFSQADTFLELALSRLLMGISGAGFVVGIKMIAEWFPEEKMGLAQGIYAGWGNFGSAGALFLLPLVATLFPEDTGWRIASLLSAVLCLIWAGVFYKYAEEIPERRQKNSLGFGLIIEVHTWKDLILQCLLLLPLYAALVLFVWKISLSGEWVPSDTAWILSIFLILAYVFHIAQCIRYNLRLWDSPEWTGRGYPFKQVFILSLVYALTFGSELSMVSIFPEFLETQFGLTVTLAGLLGSTFACWNLFTRPLGGLLSDIAGRRKVLTLLVLFVAFGYGSMGQIDSTWSLSSVIGLAIFCAMLGQAGNGACFALIPLINKDLTGKFAGIVGSYGNVGAVYFLTALSFMTTQEFFQVIALYASGVFVTLFFLEPFKSSPLNKE